MSSTATGSPTEATCDVPRETKASEQALSFYGAIWLLRKLSPSMNRMRAPER